MGQNTELRGVESAVHPEAAMDDSWQESVVKLAKAGNLRAITFWINRYLVPRGLCTQVLAEQPGHLLIRVVCHRPPDRNALVQFICQRLNSLQTEMVRTVRITAQLVGSSEVLWEQAVRLTAMDVAVVQDISQSAQGVSAPAPSVLPQSATPVANLPIAGAVSSQPYPAEAEAATPTHIPPASGGQPGRPRKKIRKLTRSQKVVRWSRKTIQQVTATPETARKLATDFADWFMGQTFPIRALTLSGSAVAVFFMGCGVELLRQYAIDPTFGQGASASRFSLPLGTKPNAVETALGSVPVTQATVLDPDNPTVSLLFSNSAALGRVSKQPANNNANLGGASYDEMTAGIAAYQQADLSMTNLDSPLSLQQVLPHTMTSPGSSGGEEAISSQLPLPEQGIVPLDDSFSAEETSEAEEISGISRTTVRDLLANGVDIVNLADIQPHKAQTSELVQTLEVLQRSEILPLGAGHNPNEARRPQIFDVKGQRIAYLGYSDPSLTEALATAAGLAPDLTSQVQDDIQAIREQVDWVIVSFHWQRSLRAYPEQWQINLTHRAIDQGADLVVGYHPYLTQGAEVYQGRPIIYSIGSSIEEGLDDYYYYEDEEVPERNTVSLQVSLQDQQMKLEFLPVQIRNGQAALATGEMGETILSYLAQASSLFDHPLSSPTVLDARHRLSLPSAPDSNDLPTDPFLAYPESQE